MHKKWAEGVLCCRGLGLLHTYEVRVGSCILEQGRTGSKDLGPAYGDLGCVLFFLQTMERTTLEIFMGVRACGEAGGTAGCYL